ncbi:MAG: Crp/Fnr family transcriptional regulator [Parvibaculaceae bacterium]
MKRTNLIPDLLQRCRHCPVRDLAVCGAMTDEQIAQLNKIAHRRIIPAGQTIVSDQEPVSFFANIISGTVKLTKTTADGRQQIVGLLFPPDFLGRAFSRHNLYFAEAATDVEICIFPNDRFEALVADYPELQHRLFAKTLDELDAAREWMLLLGRKTAEEKVASILLILAARAKRIQDQAAALSFEIPLTRADLADHLGLTIETVSRQMTRLRALRVITMVNSRLVTINDMPRLAALAGRVA